MHTWAFRSLWMAVVMPGTGLTDLASIALAEKRFEKLTGKGFRAVALGKDSGTND